jgi:hypothetical protein
MSLAHEDSTLLRRGGRGRRASLRRLFGRLIVSKGGGLTTAATAWLLALSVLVVTGVNYVANDLHGFRLIHATGSARRGTSGLFYLRGCVEFSNLERYVIGENLGIQTQTYIYIYIYIEREMFTIIVVSIAPCVA